MVEGMKNLEFGVSEVILNCNMWRRVYGEGCVGSVGNAGLRTGGSQPVRKCELP